MFVLLPLLLIYTDIDSDKLYDLFGFEFSIFLFFALESLLISHLVAPFLQLSHCETHNTGETCKGDDSCFGMKFDIDLIASTGLHEFLV